MTMYVKVVKPTAMATNVFTCSRVMLAINPVIPIIGVLRFGFMVYAYELPKTTKSKFKLAASFVSAPSITKPDVLF